MQGEGGELGEALHEAVVDTVIHKVERGQEELGVVDLVIHVQDLEVREPDVVAEEEHEELLDQDDGGEAEVPEGGPAQGAQLRHHHRTGRLLRGGRLRPHGAREVETLEVRETPRMADVAELLEPPHAQTKRLQAGGGHQRHHQSYGGGVEVRVIACKGGPAEGERTQPVEVQDSSVFWYRGQV